MTLEDKSRKRGRRLLLQRIVLATVATAGLLSMAVVAPKAIQALAKLGILDTKKRRGEYINRARNRLIAAGMLKRDERGFLRLTSEGETRLRRLELAEFKSKKPRRWDHKWRVLIFDVPEHRKTTRDKIRRTLITIGFARLQDSVWVYPYPCEELIALLKSDFKIGKDLLYLIVEQIENDSALRKRFSLPAT